MTHTPKHEATDAMGMEPCGGCGESDPAKRCIGCLHDFAPNPLSGKSGEAFALLREIFPVEDRATYDGEPDDVERSQWVTNGARRRVAALLATTLTANPSGHSDKCWGRTSYADEVMHCYCPERSATTQPAEQSGAFRLVPVKPTDKMRRAGIDITERRLAPSWTAKAVWSAMVAAAPAAEQGASSPVEGEVTDAEAERFCELVNWNPDGSEWKFVEGVMHEVKFRDLAKGYLRAALSALTTRSEAVDEALSFIEDGLKFAYERGLHEPGYDPAQRIRLSLLNQARKPEGAEPVAWRWRNRSDGVWNYQEDRQRIAKVEQQPLYAHPAHEAGEVERLRGVLKRLEAERMRPDVTAAHLKRAIAVAWADENKPQGAQQ